MRRSETNEISYMQYGATGFCAITMVLLSVRDQLSLSTLLLCVFRSSKRVRNLVDARATRSQLRIRKISVELCFAQASLRICDVP